jgi:hypothetical protein
MITGIEHYQSQKTEPGLFNDLMHVMLTIYVWPVKTFEYLIALDDKKKNSIMNILFFFSSMYVGIFKFREISSLININIFLSLIFSMLLTGLFGLFLYRTIFSLIIWSTGRLFEGKATKEQVKLVLAFSLIPDVLRVILGLSFALPAMFLKYPDLISYQNPLVSWILWIISLRILVYGLAFFNKYSYGYALLSYLLPLAIMETLQYAINSIK